MPDALTAAWSPELTEALSALLHREALRTRDLEAELGKLEKAHGGEVYSEWIHLLCRLRFEPDEAGEHWRRILEHQAGMEKQIGSSVDPRVALIHYFLEIQPRLESPIVIEMGLFEEARESAYRDELTGLRNYRFFAENLEHEVRRSDQVNQPVSLVMIDIDDFKTYNDCQGHQEGNHALAIIGRLLLEAVRVIDGVARFGGEEFSMVLPTTPKMGAKLVAERARQAIEQQAFRGEELQPGGKLTVSLGIATYPGDADSAEELLRNADRAMYAAKAKGKNLVQMFSGNRRSYRRFEASLKGSYRTLGEEHPLTTLDLSTAGLKFLTEGSLPVGALLDVHFRLPGASDDIAMAARVVSAAQGAGGSNEIAVQTLDIGARNLRTLSRYLHELEESR
jgi:diguanylate cyclase (GGDEF)-like protein